MHHITQRRLLLVEDEAVIALQQRRTLEKNGFAVQVCHNGPDAVAAACGDPDLDLVLMDIDLGAGMDGTEAARRILLERELPIVFLTSHTEREYVERVEAITRYGYVVKHAGEFVLIQSIKMAFELFDAHAQLREREQHFQSIYRNMAVGVPQVSLDKRFISANEAFCRLLGYREEELVGLHVDAVTAPESRTENERFNRRIVAGEIEHFRLEKTYIHKSGKHIHAILDASLVRNGKGEPDHLIGSVVDITEYRKTLRALERSEEKFRRIFDSTNEGILIHNLEGRMREVNQTACHMLGYSREELLELTPADLDTGEHSHAAGERISRIDAEGTLVFESLHRRKDGCVVPVEISSRWIDYEGERCIVSVVRDLSERKREEQARRRSERYLFSVLEALNRN